jgi:hypothetical protein
MRPLLHLPLAGAIALAAPATLAQSPPARAQKPLIESLQGSAKDAYKSAILLYSHGDFAGAESKYDEAYQLSRDPRLIFNEAVCEKELHHYGRMQAFLMRYAKEAGSGMPTEDRAGIDEALGAIKNLVGTVTIAANVAGAEVVVDDEPVGKTPLAAPLVLDLGRHKLALRKDGFEPATKTIDVQGGHARTEAIALIVHVETAQLLVAGEPGASIAVDGKVVATERFDGPVPAGSHEVRVTAPGKVAYQAEIELRAHESKTLQVSLTSEAQHAPVWPWILGGAVVAIGVGVGAYFLFRPQDQTNGVPPGNLGGGTLSSWSGRW